MIASLKGIVTDIRPKHIVIEVNDIGYEVKVTAHTLHHLKVGGHCKIVIHTHVREDEITLYGFEKYEEKELFLMLIGVSGIGPKSAMEILGTPFQILSQALTMGDANLLSGIPGIGKKTAEKIVLEFKNKKLPASFISTQAQPIEDDVIVALKQLGYSQQEIVNGLSKIQGEGKDTETLVTEFLKTAYRS